jgi:DUF4097 and DUF4098 domain-containing protein YvlB
MSAIRTTRLLAACLAIVPLAAAAEQGSFDRALDVSGPVSLEVKTGSGSIEVTAGPPGRVSVHGEIRVRSGFLGVSGGAEKVRRIEENPPIVQEGSVIRIGVTEDEDLLRDVSISYRITAPAETSLVARSGSGSQVVGDLRGPVDASTGSGSVRLGSIGGDVKAKSGSGSIRIDGAAGNLIASAGSGSITALRVEGSISASTGSGSIELEQSGSGNVDVHSGSGGVRLRGVRGGLTVETGSGSIAVAGEMAGDWRIDAASGDITVELPAGAAFDLDVRTSSGDIDSDHPVTVTGTINKKKLRGTVRGGGSRLDIETSSGSVLIR